MVRFNKPMVKPHTDICQNKCSLTVKSAMVHCVKNIAVRQNSSQKMTNFIKCCQVRGEKVWAQCICHIRSAFINISLNGVFGNVTLS